MAADTLRAYDLDFSFVCSGKQTPDKKSHVNSILLMLLLQLESVYGILQQLSVCSFRHYQKQKKIFETVVFFHPQCKLLAGKLP